MEVKTVATNRKARFEYQLLETFEAGLVLKGTEIKSVRRGQISLQEAYVRTDGKQAWLVGAHIAPYEHASAFQHDPDREKKLLLNKREIQELYDAVRIKGLTIIPVRVYLKAGARKWKLLSLRAKRNMINAKQLKNAILSEKRAVIEH